MIGPIFVHNCCVAGRGSMIGGEVGCTGDWGTVRFAYEVWDIADGADWCRRKAGGPCIFRARGGEGAGGGGGWYRLAKIRGSVQSTGTLKKVG